MWTELNFTAKSKGGKALLRGANASFLPHPQMKPCTPNSLCHPLNEAMHPYYQERGEIGEGFVGKVKAYAAPKYSLPPGCSPLYWVGWLGKGSFFKSNCSVGCCIKYFTKCEVLLYCSE